MNESDHIKLLDYMGYKGGLNKMQGWVVVRNFDNPLSKIKKAMH